MMYPGYYYTPKQVDQITNDLRWIWRRRLIAAIGSGVLALITGLIVGYLIGAWWG